MSIGNLKDTGNQGNNLPFQWKVLQGLQSIITNVLNVKIIGPLGQQDSSDSVSTVLSNQQANVEIGSFIKRYTNADYDAASAASRTVLSISFASVGTADARISYDGGTSYEVLKPGETLNLDAGGVMNYYDGNNLFWDTTTNAGSSLLIAINYIP
jgi:hypothetical protein